MDPTQINIDGLERATHLAARDGTSTLLAVVVIISVPLFMWFQFNKMNKTLLNIERNTKGHVSDEVLKNVMKIFISDIRNNEQSYIYNKIEKNHLAEYFNGYIENDIINTALQQIAEKKEIMLTLTTVNNVNQFRNTTKKILIHHVVNIRRAFTEELSNESIDYENLKSVTNRELEQFEQEAVNQLNQIF